MSQELRERVNEVLSDADASSGSLVAASESDGSDSNGDAESESAPDLLETAERANDLLEGAEPDELLEAVGLDTLSDGTEPDSIPAAIARGDPERVEDLRRLLKLSKLAERGDESALEDAADQLRGSIGDGEETAESGPADERDDSGDAGAETGPGEDDADESESDDSSAREAVESVAEGVSEAAGLDDVLEGDDGGETAAESREDEGAADDGSEAESDAEDGTTGDLGDQLRSAMESSFEGIGDDLEGLQQRLEEAGVGAVGDGDEAEAERADAEDGDDAEADAEEEDGLLDSGLGGNQDRGTATGGATRHSTMAPPPAKRADMKGVARHSTMPDKR